ncbi:MAG: hypothetical protein VX278_11410 [Myxococcota bacterium]|nr:hypothetical protein [Myxococcota bacterium]
MLSLLLFFACGEKASDSGSESQDSAVESTTEDSAADSGTTDSAETDSGSSSTEGGACDYGHEISTPECCACGWFCECETGSSVPDDWTACSIGYDCLDYCNPSGGEASWSDSPAADWFICMVAVDGPECEAVAACGDPGNFY